MAERTNPPAPTPPETGEPPRSSRRGAGGDEGGPRSWRLGAGHATPPRSSRLGAGGAESEHRPGDLIAGKYRLERLLGEGGMGAVWRAHNEALDMAVAIKVIRHREGAAEAERRLLQEARAAAKLEHPAIVRVFDFGESELGEPFIVMELLYGESLGEQLARAGRLSAAEAVRLLLPVAGGLAAAHAKGIVHRDLKPDNVVLVRRDDGAIAPKIVDFGIAKLQNDDGSDGLTAFGTVLGSPDYMSPEQAKGQSDVDARSDVWSLGVVLYELITGTRPFLGANYNALLTAIMLNEPAPVTDFAAGDAQLWALLRRAFEKDPAKRWPSVREFGQALAAWVAELGATTDVTGASIAAHWGSSEATPEPPFSLEIGPSTSVPSSDARRGEPTVEQPPADQEPAVGVRRRGLLALPLLAAVAALFALGRGPVLHLLPSTASQAAPLFAPTLPQGPPADARGALDLPPTAPNASLSAAPSLFASPSPLASSLAPPSAPSPLASLVAPSPPAPAPIAGAVRASGATTAAIKPAVAATAPTTTTGAQTPSAAPAVAGGRATSPAGRGVPTRQPSNAAPQEPSPPPAPTEPEPATKPPVEGLPIPDEPNFLTALAPLAPSKGGPPSSPPGPDRRALPPGCLRRLCALARHPAPQRPRRGPGRRGRRARALP